MKRPVADTWVESLLSATQQLIDPAAESPPWTEVAAEWQGFIYGATGVRVIISRVGYAEDRSRLFLRIDHVDGSGAGRVMLGTAAIAVAAGLAEGSVTVRESCDRWPPLLAVDVRLPKPHRCGRRCVEYSVGGMADTHVIHDYSAEELRPDRRSYGWTAQQFTEASRAAFAPPPKPKTCHCAHAPSAHRDRPGIGCTHRGCLCLDTPTLAAQETPCPVRSAPASPPASRPDQPSPSSPATSSPTSRPRCGRRRFGWLGTMRGGSW